MERKRNRIFSRTGWLVITLVICFLAIVPLEAKQQGSRNSNNRSSPPPKQQQAQNTSSAPRSEAKAERPQPVSQASNSRTEARRADRDAQRAQAQAKAADQARTYEAQKQQRREIAQPVQRRTEPPRANQNQSTSSPPLARQPSQVETRDVSPREPYRPEVASNDRRSEMQPTVAIRNDW
jgi:cytoskeletal protein RodZ